MCTMINIIGSGIRQSWDSLHVYDLGQVTLLPWFSSVISSAELLMLEPNAILASMKSGRVCVMGMDLPYNPPVQQHINLFVLPQTKPGIEHLLKRLSRIQPVKFGGAPPPSIVTANQWIQPAPLDIWKWLCSYSLVVAILPSWAFLQLTPVVSVGHGGPANSVMLPIEVLPCWPQTQPHNHHFCFKAHLPHIPISHASWGTFANCLEEEPLSQQLPLRQFLLAAFNPLDSQAKSWLTRLLGLDNFYCQPRSLNSCNPHGGEGIELKIGLCDDLLGTVERKDNAFSSESLSAANIRSYLAT